MRIACLGWGSLIWRPANLLILRNWFKDGPLLPIEFLRKSNDCRLTLVISEGFIPVRTLWALMATNSLEVAVESLRIREGVSEINRSSNIGTLKVKDIYSEPIKLEIQNWASTLQLDAVIWTNLQPNFLKNGNLPLKEDALAYIKSLDINKRKNAEEYIRKAPVQIDTDFRRFFEVELGWTPIL